jgi:hypothetical protein
MQSQIKPISMRYVDQVLKGYISLNQPVILWGDFGIGKTQTVNTIAKELNRDVIDIKLSMRSEVDFIGVPYVETLENGCKITKNAIPSFLPQDSDDNSILFLDELNHASHEVMKVAFKLIDERTLGESYKLPENVRIVAAANQEKYNEFVNTIETPLLNRFSHIFIDYTADDWRLYAQEQQYNEKFINYIIDNKLLFQVHNIEDMQIKLTPRVLTKAYKILNLPCELDVVCAMLKAEGLGGLIDAVGISPSENQLMDKDQKITKLRVELIDVELERDALRVENKALTIENKQRLTTKMKEENEQLREKNIELDSENRELKSSNNALQADIDGLKRKLDDIKRFF